VIPSVDVFASPGLQEESEGSVQGDRKAGLLPDIGQTIRNFMIIKIISEGDQEAQKLKPDVIFPDFDVIIENLRKL
jgi:hypothetical protein